MKTWDEGKDFRELISLDNRVTSLISLSEIEDLFDYKHYTKYVNEIFLKAGL